MTGCGELAARGRTILVGARLIQRLAYHTAKATRTRRTSLGSAIIGQVYGRPVRRSSGGQGGLQTKSGPQCPRFEPVEEIGDGGRPRTGLLMPDKGPRPRQPPAPAAP